MDNAITDKKSTSKSQTQKHNRKTQNQKDQQNVSQKLNDQHSSTLNRYNTFDIKEIVICSFSPRTVKVNVRNIAA